MTMTLCLRLDMVGCTVDNIPKTGERTLVVPPMGMPSTITSEDMAENLMVGARPKHNP